VNKTKLFDLTLIIFTANHTFILRVYETISIDLFDFKALKQVATLLETRRLTGSDADASINMQSKVRTLMNNDEIVQVRCMYEQFYNIVMAGLPIHIEVEICKRYDSLSILFSFIIE
jgi:hypothetical protein